MSAVENIWNSIATQGSRGLRDSKNIEALANSVKRLNADQQAYIITAKTGNQVLARQALETNNLTESEINNAMAKVGLMNATRGLSKVELEEALNAQLGNAEKAKELANTISLASAREMEKVSLERLTYAQFQANLTAKGLTQEQALAIGTALGYSGAIDTETIAVNDLSFATLSAKLNQLGYTQEQIKATGVALGFSSAATAEKLSIQGLSYAELQAKLTQAGLNAEQVKAITTQLGYSTATASATAATSAFSGALTWLHLTIKKIVLALKGFVLVHPIITAITAAVTVGALAWKHYKNEQEETNKAFKEALENIKERRDSLKKEVDDVQSIIDEYEELGQKTNLTSDEKERLVELQSQLNKSYDTEAKGIDLVNGKYDDQIGKIKALNAEKQKELLQQTQIARYAAQNAYNANETDILFDKQGAKALEKDFGNSDFYSRFIDAIVKKNVEGISVDINGNISISDSLNAKQKVAALRAIQDALDRVTTSAEKDTNTVVFLNNRINGLLEEYSNEVEEYTTLIDEELQLTIQHFEHNGETLENLSIENALAWKSALINEFAKDDPELRQAIEDYYHYTLIPEINRRNHEVEEAVEPIDLATWLNSDELSDVEKILGKIQTAYKNLAEEGTGFELDDDVLKQFPELAQYLDDTDKLKEKLQEVANTKIQPLLDQLIQLRDTLNIDSEEYKAVRNTILWLQQQADVTQKVKEKTQKTSDLYKDQKLQIHENITALEREVKTIDKQISALEKKKKKQDEIVKALEKEKDLLEKQIKDYETAASTVKSVLDEQVEALEKQKDSLKDGYDNQIKGIEEAYKKQIELVKKQQENYDAQIKALRDEADEQDRLNDLKEKELALEKAKNEKVRSYSSERGWEVVSNSEAISQAQKDLDKARRDNEIARLEKEKESLEERITALETERDNRTKALEEQRDREIESYEKQIKALNDYKDAWEKAKDSYQKAQDEMTTAAVLGADWRQKALDKDMEIVNTYETEYSDLQTKLKETLEPQIEAAKKLADTYSEQADALKEQKDTYKELQDDQKKYLDFFKTYAEDMVQGTKDQKQAWDDFSKAIEKFTKISGFDNLKEFYDVAMQAYDEDYISTLLGDKATADKKTDGTTNTNQLSSLEQLLNNINNSGAAKAGYTPMFTGFLQQSFLDNVEKSQKVYEAFQNSSSLLDNSARNLGVVTEQMSKSAGNWTTNNRSYQDNRVINVNGITVRMTEQEFTTYMNNYWKAMDRDSQVGKR